MHSVAKLLASGLLIVFLFSQSVAGITVEALAQTDPIPEKDEAQLNEHAAELLSQIQDNTIVAERYERMLEKAHEEDSLVLARQLTVLQEQTVSAVHELTDIIVDNEQMASLSVFRERLEEACSKISSVLYAHINKMRLEIDIVRALRSSVPVEERLDIEDRVTRLTHRLDVFYELSLTNLEKMKKLGLDIDESTNPLKESLASRADELSGRLDLDLERIDNLNYRVEETPDNTDLPVLLVAAQNSKENNVTSLDKTLDLMKALELPTDVYRIQLVAATSEISQGLLDITVAVNLVKRGFNGAKAWLEDKGPDLLVKFLLFFIILLVVYLLARILRKVVVGLIDRSSLNISVLLREMILKSVFNLVLLFGFLVALSQLGISLGPLLAGLGVAGFVIGFALQDSLANFAAGMMILIYRPYDVGDLVDLGGVFGKVAEMSLVSTTILTLDNQKILVPNGKIWGDVIKNVTAQDIRRVDMVFGISYSDDIPKAEKVLSEILKEDKRILEDPEPMVRLHTLGESSVDFVVRPWVNVQDYWDIYWHVTREVKMRFDAEGINIPFPQRDVHIYNEQISRVDDRVQNIDGPSQDDGIQLQNTDDPS